MTNHASTFDDYNWLTQFGQHESDLANKVVLDHLIFTALTAGNLATASSVAAASPSAHDANDFILYNSSTGDLSYDRDGTGANPPVKFATLTNHPNISASDLSIV